MILFYSTLALHIIKYHFHMHEHAKALCHHVLEKFSHNSLAILWLTRYHKTHHLPLILAHPHNHPLGDYNEWQPINLWWNNGKDKLRTIIILWPLLNGSGKCYWFSGLLIACQFYNLILLVFFKETWKHSLEISDRKQIIGSIPFDQPTLEKILNRMERVVMTFWIRNEPILIGQYTSSGTLYLGN